jgi:E3 ubiquitin-protein ligase SHPRH
VQWVDELQRHITPGTLSLKVYVGQYQPNSTPAPSTTSSSSKRARRTSSANARNTAAAAAAASASAAAASGKQVVTAAELAAADIVLTTYDVLKRELALQPDADAASEYSFRRRKR